MVANAAHGDIIVAWSSFRISCYKTKWEVFISLFSLKYIMAFLSGVIEGM